MIRQRLEGIFARRLEDIFKTSWRRLEDVLRTLLQDVLKKFWRRLEEVFKTSWRRLKDVSKTFLQEVLKTSWKRLKDVLVRRLEEVLKTYGQDEYTGLYQDVLKLSSKDEWLRQYIHLDEDVLKTSSRHLPKTKTKDVFIKANVCWVGWVAFDEFFNGFRLLIFQSLGVRRWR